LSIVVAEISRETNDVSAEMRAQRRRAKSQPDIKEPTTKDKQRPDHCYRADRRSMGGRHGGYGSVEELCERRVHSYASETGGDARNHHYDSVS